MIAAAIEGIAMAAAIRSNVMTCGAAESLVLRGIVAGALP